MNIFAKAPFKKRLNQNPFHGHFCYHSYRESQLRAEMIKSNRIFPKYL